MYTQEDVDSAPNHTIRFVGTPTEVVAYPINEKDLCLLVNQNGKCVYRCTLVNAFVDLEPFTDPNSLVADAFVVRDLKAAREQMKKR